MKLAVQLLMTQQFMTQELAKTGYIPGCRGVSRNNAQHFPYANIVTPGVQQHDRFRAEQPSSIKLGVILQGCQNSHLQFS
jgi:hypothetical protein